MLVLQAIVLYISNCLQHLFCCGWERGFQSSVALPCKDFGPTSLKTFLVKILKTDPCLSQLIFSFNRDRDPLGFTGNCNILSAEEEWQRDEVKEFIKITTTRNTGHDYDKENLPWKVLVSFYGKEFISERFALTYGAWDEFFISKVFFPFFLFLFS